MLLPGTMCDAALWVGVSLPAGARVMDTVRGGSLAKAAVLALEHAPARFHLLGFSLGAIVAFEILRQAPQRVARLTLISANPHAPSSAQMDTWAEQERQVRAGRFGTLTATLAPSGPQREQVLAMALRVGPEAFLEQLALLCSRPDSRPLLADYRGPLTLLVGQDDTVTPPQLADEMKTLAPQARLHVIPNAGHYLPLDAPQAVSDALRIVAYA